VLMRWVNSWILGREGPEGLTGAEEALCRMVDVDRGFVLVWLDGDNRIDVDVEVWRTRSWYRFFDKSWMKRSDCAISLAQVLNIKTGIDCPCLCE